MSYQFAHWATASAKGNGKTRSAADLCREAARVEGDCPHVAEPKPPTVLHGVDPLAALEQHDAAIKARKAALRGTGSKIRRDTHTLSAVVMSHPTPCADLDQPAARQAYEAWRDDAVRWLVEDHQARGLKVLSVVEHLDEAHPHLHVLAIATPEASPRLDVKALHPGHQAQAAHDGPKASRAFKGAMRQWQDQVWEATSAPHGLTRIGPGRRRLPRAEHLAEKEQAGRLAAALAAAEQDQAAAARARAEAEQAKRQALAMHDAAERKERAADARVAQAEQRAKAVEAVPRAIEAAGKAFAFGEVVDADAAAGEMEFAPTVSVEREAQWRQVMRPAWEMCCHIVARMAEQLRAVPEASREAAMQWLAAREAGPVAEPEPVRQQHRGMTL